MEAGRKRNIRSGEQYSHLFPKAEGTNKTIRTNADVTHTVAFIPKVVSETLDQTKMITQLLKTNNTYETCSNIWHFVYQHIAYKKDQEGYEQIRSPARAWHDRKSGVDCDCYSVFISSILSNLKIQHVLRITKYHRDYFQHIYPVVVLNGKEIPIDCVTDKFNYEVPYSEKKDYPMDLQYLNGFDGDLGQLYGKKKNKSANATAKTKKPSLLQKLSAKKAQKTKAKAASNNAKPKKKGFFKKVLNTVNRVNPATVLLRNGILAAMKLNVKNVAGRLRWSYLAPEQAAGKGIDPQKFGRLVATREKLEKIFYGAGGNPKNLKKAMLGGKGNKDKAVAGLDGISFAGIEYMNAYTPLPQLLGPDIYRSENVDGMEGFQGLGQLGEPVTLASVGAAMGVLAGIVASLKQIGNIFGGKGEGSKDFDPQVNEAAENNQPVPNTTPIPEGEAKEAAKEVMNSSGASVSVENIAPSSTNTALVRTDNAMMKSEESAYSSQTNALAPVSETSSEEQESSVVPQSNAVVTTSNAVANTSMANTTTDTPPTKETFWDKNKSWLKPVAIGVGGVSLLAIGFAVLKPKPSPAKSSSRSLSGIPKPKKRNHKRKAKHTSKAKHKHQKKTAVALL
ncbi:hypothetical protein [Flavisolibacter nicotianae]|uniref:hypothetical protein n=1 Tax=Flavisolibacter nicotianae TaxID=2364882 RepID=UPI000EAF0882|nr:hypothetical protein [Flavisolibacter nicotianae]